MALELAQEDDEPLFEKERRILGFDHADVGGALLRILHLPKRLVEPIINHHAPWQAKNHQKETAIVNLANSIAHSMQLGDTGEPVAPPMELESWETMGLSENIHLPRIQEKIQKNFENVAQVFLQYV